jgi:rhamnulokinase
VSETKSKFVAFDFGAASGRAILGLISRDKLELEEIHRFPNQPVSLLGHIYWNILTLFDALKKGLALVAQRGHRDLAGIGVDTWGVDFGLVGKDGMLLGNPVAYRDSRTDGMMEKAFEKIDRREIYALTGIQFLKLNTLYQLFSMVQSNSPLLGITQNLLFMPDLFNYLMTGEKCSEYTIASTSQLLNVSTKKWEQHLFSKLNLPYAIMAPIVDPGTVLGLLSKDLSDETGLSRADVIAPACHDTASAVAAVPAQSDDWAYLSSGTWSLIGIEVEEPVINEESLKNNFTNEGGADHKIRFLRNTMGLWLLQQVRKTWEQQGASFGYEDLVHIAGEAQPFKSIVDPDDTSFLNPPDMPAAIVEYCKKNQQQIPESKGEVVRCILESLALKYRFIIEKINAMRNRPVETLHIVGGGSQNEMLNQFSADATGLPVIAGPAEATATGNILVQAMAKGELDSLQQGRELVARSFPMEHFEPENQERWNEVYEKVKGMFS